MVFRGADGRPKGVFRPGPIVEDIKVACDVNDCWGLYDLTFCTVVGNGARLPALT